MEKLFPPPVKPPENFIYKTNTKFYFLYLKKNNFIFNYFFLLKKNNSLFNELIWSYTSKKKLFFYYIQSKFFFRDSQKKNLFRYILLSNLKKKLKISFFFTNQIFWLTFKKKIFHKFFKKVASKYFFKKEAYIFTFFNYYFFWNKKFFYNFALYSLVHVKNYFLLNNDFFGFFFKYNIFFFKNLKYENTFLFVNSYTKQFFRIIYFIKDFFFYKKFNSNNNFFLQKINCNHDFVFVFKNYFVIPSTSSYLFMVISLKRNNLKFFKRLYKFICFFKKRNFKKKKTIFKIINIEAKQKLKRFLYIYLLYMYEKNYKDDFIWHREVYLGNRQRRRFRRTNLQIAIDNEKAKQKNRTPFFFKIQRLKFKFVANKKNMADWWNVIRVFSYFKNNKKKKKKRNLRQIIRDKILRDYHIYKVKILFYKKKYILFFLFYFFFVKKLFEIKYIIQSQFYLKFKYFPFFKNFLTNFFKNFFIFLNYNKYIEYKIILSKRIKKPFFLGYGVRRLKTLKAALNWKVEKKITLLPWWNVIFISKDNIFRKRNKSIFTQQKVIYQKKLGGYLLKYRPDDFYMEIEHSHRFLKKNLNINHIKILNNINKNNIKFFKRLTLKNCLNCFNKDYKFLYNDLLSSYVVFQNVMPLLRFTQTASHNFFHMDLFFNLYFWLFIFCELLQKSILYSIEEIYDYTSFLYCLENLILVNFDWKCLTNYKLNLIVKSFKNIYLKLSCDLIIFFQEYNIYFIYFFSKNVGFDINLFSLNKNIYDQLAIIQKQKKISYIFKGKFSLENNYIFVLQYLKEYIEDSKYLFVLENFFLNCQIYDFIKKFFKLYLTLLDFTFIFFDNYIINLINKFNLNNKFVYLRYFNTFLILCKTNDLILFKYLFKNFIILFFFVFLKFFLYICILYNLSKNYLIYCNFKIIKKNKKIKINISKISIINMFLFFNFIKLKNKNILIISSIYLLKMTLNDIINYFFNILKDLYYYYIFFFNKLKKYFIILEKACFFTIFIKLKNKQKYLKFSLFKKLFYLNKFKLNKINLNLKEFNIIIKKYKKIYNYNVVSKYFFVLNLNLKKLK